jgi:molecular chaperone DnaJ
MVMQVRDTLLGRMQTTTTCPRCRGRGKLITNPCKKCHGSGLTEVTRSIEVTIPAGVDNGNMLRIAGQGHSGREGGPAGDLLVSISVEEDKLFERDDADLRVTMPVHYSDLVLGANLEVPTLQGKEKLRLPAGTASHHVFTLRGHGMPRLRGGGRGNLYVVVTVAVPQKTGKEQRELLGRLKDEDLAAEKKGSGLLYRLLKRK